MSFSKIKSDLCLCHICIINTNTDSKPNWPGISLHLPGNNLENTWNFVSPEKWEPWNSWEVQWRNREHGVSHITTLPPTKHIRQTSRTLPISLFRSSKSLSICSTYLKVHEIYVFCSEEWRKLLQLLLLTCELRISAFLHRRELVTTRENSRDFLLRRHEGSHSHWHLPNKTMFWL